MAWGPLLGYLLATGGSMMTVKDGKLHYVMQADDLVYKTLWSDFLKGVENAMALHGQHMEAPTMRILPAGLVSKRISNAALLQPADLSPLGLLDYVQPAESQSFTQTSIMDKYTLEWLSYQDIPKGFCSFFPPHPQECEAPSDRGDVGGSEGVKAGGEIIHLSHGGSFSPALEPLLQSFGGTFAQQC